MDSVLGTFHGGCGFSLGNIWFVLFLRRGFNLCRVAEEQYLQERLLMHSVVNSQKCAIVRYVFGT